MRFSPPAMNVHAGRTRQQRQQNTTTTTTAAAATANCYTVTACMHECLAAAAAAASFISKSERRALPCSLFQRNVLKTIHTFSTASSTAQLPVALAGPLASSAAEAAGEEAGGSRRKQEEEAGGSRRKQPSVAARAQPLQLLRFRFVFLRRLVSALHLFCPTPLLLAAQ
jgi:hypothetical protein